MAAYLAMLVTEGILDNGLIPEPGPVLYLDYETSSATAARRFNTLYAGFGFEHKSSVLYRFCFQPLASEIQEIQRIASEHGIQLIIVDSAGPACGGEPESASASIQYFAALRSLRATTLTIAHKAKGSSNGPFGSVYWMNYPRSVYEIKKAQDEGENLIHVGLFHRKVNDGKLLKPMGFKFDFDENAVSVTKEDVWGRMAIVDTKPFKLRVILHRIFVERPQVTGIPAWPGGAACYRRSRYIL